MLIQGSDSIQVLNWTSNKMKAKFTYSVPEKCKQQRLRSDTLFCRKTIKLSNCFKKTLDLQFKLKIQQIWQQIELQFFWVAEAIFFEKIEKNRTSFLRIFQNIVLYRDYVWYTLPYHDIHLFNFYVFKYEYVYKTSENH